MLICCRRIRAGRFPVPVRPHPDGFGTHDVVVQTCMDEFGVQDFIARTCMNEFGTHDAVAHPCTDEFGTQNAIAHSCTDEFGTRDVIMQTRMDEFGAQNATAQPCMDKFGAPNAYLSAAERKFVVPNAHLSSDESLSATTLRGLGAAAPSGAGESGWFGGRKPPLPSRGVVSLQKVPPASKRKNSVPCAGKESAARRRMSTADAGAWGMYVRGKRPTAYRAAIRAVLRERPAALYDRGGVTILLLAYDVRFMRAVYHAPPAFSRSRGRAEGCVIISAAVRGLPRAGRRIP